MIPVLVVSLPHDAERRRWMDAGLRSFGISYELIDGVDGRAIPDDEASPHLLSFRRGYGRDMTRGELGCALAHLMLFRRIAAGHDEFVCTMEDDIGITPAILPFLEEAALRTLPSFDVLKFFDTQERRTRTAWKVATMQNHDIVVPLRSGWSLQAQVITKAGAAKMADWPITAPIDGIFHDHPPRGLRIMEVRPSLVQRLDFGSNTAPWLLKRPAKTYRLKLRAESYRIKRLLLTRLHFVTTWGLRGIVGLFRWRYRPRASIGLDSAQSHQPHRL